MYFKKALVTAIGIVHFSSIQAETIHRESFLPDNNLHQLPDNRSLVNLDEDEFNQIISHAETVYRDAFEKRNLTLVINRLWNNTLVNATTIQSEGTATINMFGGLARRPEVTKDAFTLVICHEIGHHLGGYPFYPDSSWAGNEGSADYFATHICLPKIWEHEPIKLSQAAESTATKQCNQSWPTARQRDLCYRIADAGLSIGNLFASLRERQAPSFNTPSTRVTTRTLHSHPPAQCRLDTFLAGSLCMKQDPKHGDIPGLDAHRNKNLKAAEEETAKSSCMLAKGDLVGFRPQCWFAPEVNYVGLAIKNLEVIELEGNSDGFFEAHEAIGLKIQLENKSNVPATKATLQIRSGYRGLVNTNKKQIENLQVGEERAFVLPLPLNHQATCGSSISIEFIAQSEQGAVAQKIFFDLGPKSIDSFYSQRLSDKIPNNGYSLLKKRFQIDRATKEKEPIILSLDLDHSQTQDLNILLVSPDGMNHQIIQSGIDLFPPVFPLEFELKHRPNDTKGIWTLKVFDTKGADSPGILKQFELKTQSFECSSAI